jgi:hypothetical protein
MTLRALMLGLLGALLLCGPGILNDQVVRLESVTAGHLLPVSVFAVMFLLGCASACAGLLGARWRLSAAEMALVGGLMLVACSIPGRGLMESFPSIVATPAHWDALSPGWRRINILSYAPPQMLVSGGTYDPHAVGGFVTGLGRPGEPIGVGDVPWKAWAGPLATWLPMVVLTGAASICLGLVVHRQWSANERLRYPIAQFAWAMLSPQGGKSVWRRRPFWIALGAVAIVHLLNGLAAWYPQTIAIPLTFDFGAISQAYPDVARAQWGQELLRFRLFPCVIGFAFFVASEISLTLGLSQVLFVAVSMALIAHGVDMRTEYFTGGSMGWQKFGSYLALGLVVAYLGRAHYGRVLAKAVGLRSSAPPMETWACRGLLVALALLVALLSIHGMPWTLAVLMVLLMMLLLVMVARITAETGLFFVQARWLPIGVMLGLLGPAAMGPGGMVTVAMACAVLCLDASQALLPYLVNALKLTDLSGIKPVRFGGAAAGVLLASLAVAVVVALWSSYNFGAPRINWGFERTPKSVFGVANDHARSLEFSGELQASAGLSPLERIAAARPTGPFVAWTLTGAALVAAFSVLRLRYSWWPLHPVLFLVWGTYPMAMLSASFLLGWGVKTAVAHFGGHARLERLKPLMVGLIAGDLLGLAFWMITGATYWGIEGVLPHIYSIMPR